MRNLISFCVLTALVACGASDNRNSINREARALNTERQAAAQKSAQNVTVNGRVFRVAVVKEGSFTTAATDRNLDNFVLKENSQPYALVNLVSPAGAAYVASDVETAARAASGCAATFNAGVLAFVGGFSTTTDLGPISQKVSDFKGWRTNLSC